MKADGYSLDDKRDKIDSDDLPDIIERYKNLDKELDRKRTDVSFLVPKAEIVDQNYDLSINRYKEIEYEAVEYDTPREIINGKDGEPGLRQLAEERLKTLDELEGMV
jgi:type I restriction enzyme M protein